MRSGVFEMSFFYNRKQPVNLVEGGSFSFLVAKIERHEMETRDKDWGRERGK